MGAEGEGETVGGDDAVSRLRTGDWEGAGQGVTAGPVWADCEEGSQGQHLWLSFVFFSQGHTGVSTTPVCETDTSTPQI